MTGACGVGSRLTGFAQQHRECANEIWMFPARCTGSCYWVPIVHRKTLLLSSSRSPPLFTACKALVLDLTEIMLPACYDDCVAANPSSSNSSVLPANEEDGEHRPSRYGERHGCQRSGETRWSLSGGKNNTSWSGRNWSSGKRDFVDLESKMFVCYFWSEVWMCFLFYLSGVTFLHFTFSRSTFFYSDHVYHTGKSGFNLLSFVDSSQTRRTVCVELFQNHTRLRAWGTFSWEHCDLSLMTSL